jgi:hypothetical protein
MMVVTGYRVWLADSLKNTEMTKPRVSWFSFGFFPSWKPTSSLQPPLQVQKRIYGELPPQVMGVGEVLALVCW